MLISGRIRVKAFELAEVTNEYRDALVAVGSMSNLLEDAKAKIGTAGFNEVEYLGLRDGTDLSLRNQPVEGSRLFAAAWLAGVRLIDNIAV
jgi:pantoate--beta-alanine ligase